MRKSFAALPSSPHSLPGSQPRRAWGVNLEGSSPFGRKLRARPEREGSLTVLMLSCTWHASCHTHHGTMLATDTKTAGWGSWRTGWLTKLGATGVALALLVQVKGLCFCVTRAPAPTDPHACCPRPAPKPGGSAAPASSLSMTDQTEDCCPTGLRARTVVRLNERGPLPLPAPYLVSSAASFTTLADHATPFGATTGAPARTFSPPQSPVLRI